MTCRQVERWIVDYAASQPVPSEAAAHIAGCVHCRSLAASIGYPDAPVALGPEQLQGIKSGILADLRPVKPLARPVALCGALLAISVAAVMIGASELGIAGWEARDTVQRIAVFTVLVAGSGLFAFSLVCEVVPGSRMLVPVTGSIAGILATCGGIFAISFQVHQERAFVATGLVCLRIGLECAVAVSVIFWLVLRRGAALNRVAAGALTGALAGLSGVALLETFCPNLNKYHVLAWHLGAALASTIVGTVAGTIAQRTRMK